MLGSDRALHGWRRAALVAFAALNLVVVAGAAGAAAPQVSFVAPELFGVKIFPVAIDVGDVNRDSAPDLAVANRTSNSVSVLLGDGAGGYSPGTTVDVGSLPSAVALADLNQD